LLWYEEKKHLVNLESFVVETTLTGRSTINLILEAKKLGYEVFLIYISLKNIQSSAIRVAFRVAKGGHDVPREAINRRYTQSLENLPKAAKLADNLYIFDNSGKKYKLLLNLQQGQIKYVNEKQPRWMQKNIIRIINELQRDESQSSKSETPTPDKPRGRGR